MDTIYALASAQGRAGISVIRVSGSQAHGSAARLMADVPQARVAATRVLRVDNGDILDHALVLRFDGPGSFTGEDVMEYHIHGSISVQQALLNWLSQQPGHRLAEPGEFTRRAMENGRLDLAQVEGLADLIDAETEAQRKQAVRVFSGALGERVEAWRSKLIRAAALLEATIDFADEDVPVDVTPEVTELLTAVEGDLDREIRGSFVAERIRSGFEVAIVGPPNAGKSTLLNRLAGREAAITSDIAGTTRDVIEVRMDINGLPISFLDTAGLRDSTDEVEVIGVARAMERAEAADLRVFLTTDPDDLPLVPKEIDIILTPKVDLTTDLNSGISGKTGQGVDELLAGISEIFSEKVAQSGSATHARHRSAMLQTKDLLVETQRTLSQGSAAYDIAAEDLRTAIRALEALVGRIGVETLLNEIFASFCLGK
ncbi:tRNA uridine-5-carboxymethylaminomethyl(34) synthesis GTPase MnmE [uncultured Roseobacter sp.]|uniref:tRNA uridine-5-carboxymethylaminomethyl(34) synthesis GTPase MnmE n=1 Tax=uncultured Roseobacter sp. TaxID=114847 RepID=UPI00262B823D|nr:tRNA uridine-5-carboxymethylaminomethyl(34) synthesis GTPase MnmE [uncultured Roseobacter sp.]